MANEIPQRIGQVVDEPWLYERGHLHDASIEQIRITGDALEIDICDEWVNERGLSLPEDDEAPAILSFGGVLGIEAHVSDWSVEMVSELTVKVLPEGGVQYPIVFSNSDTISVRCASFGKCLPR